MVKSIGADVVKLVWFHTNSLYWSPVKCNIDEPPLLSSQQRFSSYSLPFTHTSLKQLPVPAPADPKGMGILREFWLAAPRIRADSSSLPPLREACQDLPLPFEELVVFKGDWFNNIISAGFSVETGAVNHSWNWLEVGSASVGMCTPRSVDYRPTP